MTKQNLSQRLLAVAQYVPVGSKLLDVGSDHAYLPIYLLEEGMIAAAIASEVVAGPYQSALTNAQAAALTDRLSVRLANGLAAFDPADQVTAISICGMGGRLIADILEAGKDKLGQIERLILQPNNREDDLRRWLITNGFKLVAEYILCEAGKFYEILVAERGQTSLTEQDYRFGPFLSQEQSPAFVDKWERELGKLQQALEKIPSQHEADRSAISQKIQTIKEVLGHESA